jgi:hypothetical protein
MERGHHVALLGGLMPTGPLALKSRIEMQIRKRLSGCKISKDMGLDYPVWRTWFPWEAVAHVARHEKPDLIVVMSGDAVRIALAAKAARIPLLVQLQNVEFQLDGGNFRDLSDVPCIANSHFTADKYQRAYGFHSTVICIRKRAGISRSKSRAVVLKFLFRLSRLGRSRAIFAESCCKNFPCFPTSPCCPRKKICKIYTANAKFSLSLAYGRRHMGVWRRRHKSAAFLLSRRRAAGCQKPLVPAVS